MTNPDPAAELQEHGMVLLRGAFPIPVLSRMHHAATRCFRQIASGVACPETYRFNRFSHSFLLTALTGFGCAAQDLEAPLSAPGLRCLIAAALGREWNWSTAQSWVRKKFAPTSAPDPFYRPHSWHQDGALGVQFPLSPGSTVPMTDLLTCWIPLTPCGDHSPGLELVRLRQNGLLHFTELTDASVRRRFAADQFCAPALRVGDGLLFLNGTLHQTYQLPHMTGDRLSVEYRLFPR